MSVSYWQKLKDPRWQKRRLEILSKAEFVCEVCQDKQSTLHVHHLRYDKGKDPWEYDDKWLACLCESCHEEWHEAKELLAQAAAGLPANALRQVAGYAFGLSGSVFELMDKGMQRLDDASDMDVADGIYDAIRKWLPQQPGVPDVYEHHVHRFFREKGAVYRGDLWAEYTATLGRKRGQ